MLHPITHPPMNLFKTLAMVGLVGVGMVYGESVLPTSKNQHDKLPVIEVSLNTDYTSVDQFVQSLQSFNPSKTKNGIADLFSAIQKGQPELNDTGTRVYPDSIQSVKVLFKSDSKAVVFSEANPHTEATPSTTSVLFSLSCENGMKKWRILDTRRFYASGKHAGISTKVTSTGGTEYDQKLRSIVMTVTINDGGRGSSSVTSESFRLNGWGQLSQISQH
jgi:hypothetical protein